MELKTEDQFRAELEEARRDLRQQGRDFDVGDSVNDHDGLACDFDLPYSSLPSISKERWN